MKRQLLMLFTLATLLVSMPLNSAFADGFGRGGGHGRGIRHTGHNFHGGLWRLRRVQQRCLGIMPSCTASCSTTFRITLSIRRSTTATRCRGRTATARLPIRGYIMTPESCEPQPLEIINPHVPAPQQKSASVETERAAAVTTTPEPLVILNPFATPTKAVATNER